MVKVCAKTYENEEIYAEHFAQFGFPLSPFQKYAIEAIVTGNHILVTAHTGSGKTLPAEFSIEYFVGKGKKVIYTSPIKALSNQKYYEFTAKFPEIKFGILTGDIKSNPEADVLIMTTEILQNTLYRKKHGGDGTNSNINLAQFDIDLDNELACVIFDEVHYINDLDRGKVWEETIMMLPQHIQMVMLSATLDAPEKFAAWCETRGNSVKQSDKCVYLATTYERVVPLTHYSFITATQGLFKAIGKDKDLEKQIKDVINKPHVIQSAKGEFSETNYNKMKKILTLLDTKQVRMKRANVLNQVCKYLVENNMLPAICFVLSRKQLEQCADEITIPLLEDDSKVGYTIRRECEQIIRRLPNHKEYLELPEYIHIVSLLEKGIGIHHAGIMPVLREMVELLFGKGCIKILFATETFAVGINMPTKTVIFTDVNKFDGSGSRILLPHEYTQMAGRAGRRGIDTIGNVIHLNNLFRNVELTDYKNMMHGRPQKLVSKFKISYNLLLNLIDIGSVDFLQFIRCSMIQGDINAELNEYSIQEEVLFKKLMEIENIKTPQEVVERYLECEELVKFSVNKKRKELEKELQEIGLSYPSIAADKVMMRKFLTLKEEYDTVISHKTNAEEYLTNQVQVVLDFLEKDGFVESIEEGKYRLSLKGSIATHLREVHCLVFARLIESNKLDSLSTNEIVAMFSCFTNVSVPEEKKTMRVHPLLREIVEMYDYYEDFESMQRANTGQDYSLHYDLVDYMDDWVNAESVGDCQIVLQTLDREKDIYLGEFVKAILKINNISSEMEKMAEYIGNIGLLHKLKEIPLKTLKFVATNQSLYV